MRVLLSLFCAIVLIYCVAPLVLQSFQGMSHKVSRVTFPVGTR